jgi:hypothetical protein
MRPNLSHTISIKLIPSKLLLGLIGCVSIVSCLILCYLPIAFLIKLFAIVIVLASSLYFILRDALLLLPWSWRMIEVDNKGQLKLLNQRGETFLPQLHASSFVHSKLIILNFKNGRFDWTFPPVILFSRAEHAEEHRRLRVWLLWFRDDEKIYDKLTDEALDL